MSEGFVVGMGRGGSEMKVDQIVERMKDTHCGDWPYDLIKEAKVLEEEKTELELQLEAARAEIRRIDRIMRECLAQEDMNR